MLDSFVPKKRRQQPNGDPPFSDIPKDGSARPIARPLDSLDVLGEDAQRYFARVEQQRIAGEQMAVEIERLTKVNMRLEAEADVRDVALSAVTAERDQLLHRVAELDTEMGVIATLIVNWGDKVRASMKKPAPTVDMDALQAAVAEDKDG